MPSLVLVIAFSAAVGTAPVQGAPQPTLVITNVTLVDGTGAAPRRGVTVTVSGARIESIVHVPRGPSRASAQVIDGTGKFLIPGLWDMHVHLAAESGRDRLLAVLVQQGITSVRDMGTNMELIASLRARIARGDVIGPRIKSAGFMIESPRSAQFWDAPRARNTAEGLPDPFANARRLVASGPEDGARVVDSVHAAGADFVKLIDAATRETFFAIARASQQRGLPLVGHAPATVGVTAREAFEAGLKSVEHTDPYGSWFDRLTTQDRDATFALMRGRGASLVPTLVVSTRDPTTMASQLATMELGDSLVDSVRVRQWKNWWATTYGSGGARFGSPEQRAATRAMRSGVLRAAHAAGVRILPGTDLGSPLILPGSSLHDELELLVQDAGLSPVEALHAATRVPAEFFGLSDSLGTLKPGMLADMVLLDADPTVDIRNTRRVAAVVFDGRVAYTRR